MAEQSTKTDQDNGKAAARRTRRQLLAGGTGALAAVLTAEALARPAPAAAANGDNVILGSSNFETATTFITNSAADQGGLNVTCTGAASALLGECAGTSGQGVGVFGVSNAGNGVYGQSGTSLFPSPLPGVGVQGITDHISGAGVVGDNIAAFGTGVLGNSPASGIGVLGTSSEADGTGVAGEATSATAVGVLADNSAGGTALEVIGKASFTRSGVLTVAAGKSSATKSGVALTAASLVLATVQQNVAGVWVASAVPNVAGSSFTVHLSKAVAASTKVAWFVVN
jgi:hypothetical protein